MAQSAFRTLTADELRELWPVLTEINQLLDSDELQRDLDIVDERGRQLAQTAQ